MKIGWCKVRVKGFSDPIKVANRSDGWAWRVLFGGMVVIGILIILKITGRI